MTPRNRAGFLPGGDAKPFPELSEAAGGLRSRAPSEEVPPVRVSIARRSKLAPPIGQLSDGHYGVCVCCGGDISEEVLGKRPDTILCSCCHGALENSPA